MLGFVHQAESRVLKQKFFDRVNQKDERIAYENQFSSSQTKKKKSQKVVGRYSDTLLHAVIKDHNKDGEHPIAETKLGPHPYVASVIMGDADNIEFLRVANDKFVNVPYDPEQGYFGLATTAAVIVTKPGVRGNSNEAMHYFYQVADLHEKVNKRHSVKSAVFLNPYQTVHDPKTHEIIERQMINNSKYGWREPPIQWR